MDERAQHIVGIDVSKDRLDVHALPAGEHFTLARDEAGLKALIKRLAKQSVHVVAMEATGGLEGPEWPRCTPPGCRCGWSIVSGFSTPRL
jgi:hypothetical protein